MRTKRRRNQHLQTLPTEMAQDPFMPQTEVAEFFRGSSNTVNRWIRKGALKPTRTLGGHKRFRTSEILALAGLNKPVPDPPPAA